MMHRCVDEKRFGVLFSAVLLLSFILCASSALAASAMVNVDVPTGTFKSIKLNRLPKGASIEVQIESTGSLFVAMVTSKGLLETSKPLFVGQVDRKLSFTVVIPAPPQKALAWDKFNKDDKRLESFEILRDVKKDHSKLSTWLQDAKWWSDQTKEFEQWIYESDSLSVLRNKDLAIQSDAGESRAAFEQRCTKLAQDKLKTDVEVLERKFQTKLTSAQNKMERQKLRVDKYESEVNNRRLELLGKGGQAVFSLLTKKKVSGLSSSLTKNRMLQESQAKLGEAQQVLSDYQEGLTNVQNELESQKADIHARWSSAPQNIEEIRLTPTKQRIRVDKFGILWE